MPPGFQVYGCALKPGEGPPIGLVRTILASPVLDTLTTPHGIDRYLELVNPMWSVHEIRARVEHVRREAPGVATLTLRPTGNWQGSLAGQHVQVGVLVDGVRRTRCFSLSSSEHRRDGRVAITVKRHDAGHVSRYLTEEVPVGTVVHLSPAEGDFSLPRPRPGRMLMVSGGSGITPLMSMLRTLCDEGHAGSVTFLHYARTAEDAIFADELADIAADFDFADVVTVHTRGEGGPLTGRFDVEHLRAVAPDFAGIPTYLCGPNGLIDRVRQVYDDAGAAHNLHVEHFKTPSIAADPSAEGTIEFRRSALTTPNTGQTLLEQAERSGLGPAYGCRMGICKTCTTHKAEGTVRDVISGAESSMPDEDIQICVSAPVGDCALDL
jgi:stearoyl-CoA 9-desaturase NADPH oxidoreductase